jgi:hypothetical protein
VLLKEVKLKAMLELEAVRSSDVAYTTYMREYLHAVVQLFIGISKNSRPNL